MAWEMRLSNLSGKRSSHCDEGTGCADDDDDRKRHGERMPVHAAACNVVADCADSERPDSVPTTLTPKMKQPITRPRIRFGTPTCSGIGINDVVMLIRNTIAP
ncbi:hypothetical protein L0Z36_21275 [Burkholderia multivorans]|uniref:hypothetical protein n=1 Tax=Burkholderia multivorans TaxID=87883 RepID=UPI0020184B7D|nr:hypothetical protein [Burkholderia multivorans]UQP03928.1 hypothetical protein L0Z36_21275 [Burkholderia multivorans]